MSSSLADLLVDRRVCPLCGGLEAVVHLSFPDIPVMKCVACGFMFSGKVLPDAELARYYADGFGGRRHEQGQMVNAAVNAAVLQRLLDLRGVSSVLDVGTGYGFLLQELRDRYRLNVTGVELSQQEAEYARQHLGLKVISASLASSGLPKESFDLVTSFEVIEHVASPVDFLKELAGYVKPGGLMLIMTDNFEGRMVRALGAEFPKWIPHTHISHLSAETLERTIESTGHLEVENAVSYTPWEFLLRNAYYTLRGIRKTPAQAFDLQSALKTEMTGEYKHFQIRKRLNSIWARLTLDEDLQGDVMYFLCRRTR